MTSESNFGECICGVNKKVHTAKCKRNRRSKYLLAYNKKKRQGRVKNKCCANCGDKVKPKIIIPYRCECCQDKIRKYDKKRNLKLGGKQ